MKSSTCGLMLVAGLAMGSPHASDEADAVKKAWFSTPITVSATGDASIGRVEGVSGKLAEVVSGALAKRRYLPAVTDGEAVSAESRLSGVLVLTPRGDSYGVAFEDLSLAPGMKHIDPPRFPGRMFEQRQSGYVELRVSIAPDGKVTKVDTVASSDEEFERAAREPLRKARFDPVKVRGLSTGTENSILVLFRFEQSPPPAYQPVCTHDSRQPGVEGGSSCLPVIEVTATKRSGQRIR